MLNNAKRLNFKKFLVLKKKLQLFRNSNHFYKVLFCTAQATDEILAVVSVKKKLAFSRLEFYAAKKPLLKYTDYGELNKFTNMVAKVRIEALKI